MNQIPSASGFFANPVLEAVDRACQMIPPAWPLSATVAVNPFLGHAEETLPIVAARMERIGGPHPLMPRAWYRDRLASGEIEDGDIGIALGDLGLDSRMNASSVKAAAGVERDPVGPLATVADILSAERGFDFPVLVEERLSIWAQGYFDEGQAMWRPARLANAFASWREFATHDLVPELVGLKGFCRKAQGAPASTADAVIAALGKLGVSETAAESYCHQLLLRLRGWAQAARLPGWLAEQKGERDETLYGFLAAYLQFEKACLDLASPRSREKWAGILRAHAAPLVVSDDILVDCVLQTSVEVASRRNLARTLSTNTLKPAGKPTEIKAFFCIDVRSEVFRRALECVSPCIETGGFAGFFGIGSSHHRFASDVPEHRLPVLLPPAVSTTASTRENQLPDTNARIARRARRALDRFKAAAVSSFAYVEAAGLGYALRLARGALRQEDSTVAEPAPYLNADLSTKITMASGILQAMSMTQDFPPLILLIGHGAQVVNNPFASALHCGACGGHAGDVNARVLAGILNEAEVRQGLVVMGITIPQETVFVAGLHDTTSDQVTLFEDFAKGLTPQISQARCWLDQASALARVERAARLPGASNAASLTVRGKDWSELRPEWGLAGCAAFIAAPRSRTRGLALEGRSFLHDYDWRKDDGFKVLELIMTAPVVVASWISLQYFGSSVAPDMYGSGNKMLHNVAGGIGVLEGNSGPLRTGLPWQSVHDGERLVHDPVRLCVLVAAPIDAITTILERHTGVRALFDNAWLSLVALDDLGRPTSRYIRDLRWGAL
ncbi:YbcC family protein [Aquibium oceanicum]|uniref:Probable inorganic carbon transporter subunit DabA n=1 Tax=Aquibium oceanicum TaxID=1670800 RepID=A0A1L3SXX9_9HYPH|nr:DUF2309 domain-containing protein [Aquibium oceanicum]APH74165.1 hypothetical protein BSQ44_24410 [Aquibium oceanicum]